MHVAESGFDRGSRQCTVFVAFGEHGVVLRPRGVLDARATDLLAELVRAARESGVEVSVDLTEASPR